MQSSKIFLGMLLGGFFGAMWAGQTPDAVGTAEEELARLEEEFWVRSAPARLTFLCLGRFADDEQKKILFETTSSSVRQAEALLENLARQITQMEQYTGEDWESRFGQTGLWSAAQQGLLRGRYLKTLFQFWSALCAEGQKQTLLTQVIEDCKAEEARWQGQEQILQVLAMQQRQADGDEEQMKMILHQMMLRDDLSEPARERMLLLQKRFELFVGGPFEEQIAHLFQRKTAAKEDFEWALEYAFFEWSHGRPDSLKQVQQTWPSSQPFISGLVSEWEAERFETVQRPAWEAELQQFAIRASRSRDPNEREQIEQQWIQWIQSLDQSRPAVSTFRRQAAAGYVYYLFDKPDRQNVEKIVRFLEGEVEEGEAVLGYLYVQALSLKEDYARAVPVLCKIPVDCRNAAFDLYVLEAFVERLEEFSGLSSITLEPLVMKRAEQIAACGESAGEQQKRARLLWAEMAARLPNLPPTETERLDQFLQEQKDSAVEPVIRCRAFRRMQQGQWGLAVKDWQRVRSAYEPSDRTQKQRSWHWWRAKYYELYCSAKMSEVASQDVRHAIGVLETLYAPPPAVWQTRLKELSR